MSGSPYLAAQNDFEVRMIERWPSCLRARESIKIFGWWQLSGESDRVFSTLDLTELSDEEIITIFIVRSLDAGCEEQ